MKSRLLVALLFILSFGAAACESAASAPIRPGLSPCQERNLPEGALCGTHEVFENRAARTGRKIPLRIVVLPATGRDRLSDPLTFFAGGPGDASIPEGIAMAWELESLRGKRDVLLVDFRGTGQSGALSCPELEGDVQGFLDDFLPTDKIRACRDRLSKEVDLSWYTTDAAVDDVEEVRTALGYGPLNLMGGSYGTRAVLTYLRRHPQSVRTATLSGVLDPEARYPLGMSRASQEALDGLIAECEGDPACRNAFPKLRQEVDAVLSRAASEPARVEWNDPRTGPVELRLTRTGVVQTLRYMLYSPAEAALVPLDVHRAAQGDWKPLGLLAHLQGLDRGGMAQGFYQSVTCAEDVAFLREEEIAPAVAGTFVGDFRVRRQKAACEGWPVRDLGPDLHAPVVSDVPALLISGERDPATPAANGERASRTLKRSRHVIVPDGSHNLTGMQGAECVPGLIAAFIDAGTADGLDTSCISRMRRPDFELPEVTVARADLEGLQGSYEQKELGLAVKIDLRDDRLRLTVLQGPPFPPALLIPTSPTRFRWEGVGVAPGLALVFEKPGTLTVVQPGKPRVEMQRSK
ncbi:MAG TPA: alpha/beta fold hydrolase [Thermoanaerobaculia bacterium]|nr:alpha/beta fold hydrolase [Thermoanaerobaculia bacterium]